MNYKTKLICAFLIPAMTATGQEYRQWTLQECIDYALEHNIQLRQNKVTVEQGMADLEQAKAELFPSLSLSTTQSLNYRPLQESVSNIVTNGIANSSSNKLTGNGNYGLNASWTVWNGGANRKNIKAQKLQNEMSELAVQETANSIQEQIARLYVQILYSKDALVVNESMYKTAQSQYERGKDMYEQGQIAKADLAQLEAQVSSSQYDCVTTKTLIDDYKRQLKVLLEITDGRDFDVASVALESDEVALQLLPTTEEVYQKALEQRPEIKSGELGLEVADVNIDIARAGYFPTVSFTAGLGDSHYSGSNESVGEQMRQNFNLSGGITLSVPIFDNKRNKTNVAKAKLTKMDSQLQLQDAQNQLYSAIDECRLNAYSSQQKLIAAEASVKSAETSYELLDEQFKNGLKNIVELMTGRDQLLSAQQEKLQSKYTALLNIQLLKFYQGESINL